MGAVERNIGILAGIIPIEYRVSQCYEVNDRKERILDGGKEI